MPGIKLLQALGDRPAGSLFATDDVYASRLVADGKATRDTTGAFKWPLAKDCSVLGPYTDVATLEAAYPAANNQNCLGLVGSSAPYTVVTPSGGSWSASGYTPPDTTAISAPASLNSSNIGTYIGGRPVLVAAASTLEVHDSAYNTMTDAVVLHIAAGGDASLAFTGSATKENASGVSNTTVALAASGVYALIKSQGGYGYFRLTGGASL